jgi:iron(III) transport system ATP-binding protein
MKILEAIKLDKKYPGTHDRAVTDFSLEVKTGEIIALLGESGCGKTTILRMIAGFEMPDSGELYIYGNKIVDADKFVEPEKRGVGLVFQDNALFPHKTVAQNIGFGLHQLKKRDAQNRVAEVVSLTGLEGFEKRYPYQLSGGQQQRVALARAMAPRPALILFDEPFSNIDTLMKNKLREDISNILRKTGSTAIFVTHDTKDAMALADKVVMLRAGMTIQMGTPEQIYKLPNSIYVAEFFGKANIISVSAVGEFYNNYLKLPAITGNKEALVCIRPDAILPESAEKSGSYKAFIISEQFFGEYKEIVCSTRIDGKRIELLAYCSPNQVFENETCFIHFDKTAIQLMTSL